MLGGKEMETKTKGGDGRRWRMYVGCALVVWRERVMQTENDKRQNRTRGKIRNVIEREREIGGLGRERHWTLDTNPVLWL